jgi:2-amino-4-hydroxy-6-hydroxymethyldihydropteridine diphosphokinase
MVAVQTTLSPLQLLDALHEIEAAAGRIRRTRWEPRTLDLDLVLFGSQTLKLPRLTLPHPELPNREFWQRELEQIRTLTGTVQDK